MWIDGMGKRRPDCKRTCRQAELNSHAARKARGGVAVEPLRFPKNWGRSGHEPRIVRPPKRLIVTPQEAMEEPRHAASSGETPVQFGQKSLRERLAEGVQVFNPVNLARKIWVRKTG